MHEKLPVAGLPPTGHTSLPSGLLSVTVQLPAGRVSLRVAFRAMPSPMLVTTML